MCDLLQQNLDKVSVNGFSDFLTIKIKILLLTEVYNFVIGLTKFYSWIMLFVNKIIVAFPHHHILHALFYGRSPLVVFLLLCNIGTCQPINLKFVIT